jgi:2-oxoglutarate dehydrogenase E2 component (dihydrolipoamide succinyltransferase)
MPQMGESIAEGTLSRWLKKPGDTVKRDEAIFEISTDKVDAEIPSPAAGVLVEILVAEGVTVPVQAVVARLETDASAAAVVTAPPASPPCRSPPTAPWHASPSRWRRPPRPRRSPQSQPPTASRIDSARSRRRWSGRSLPNTASRLPASMGRVWPGG